MSSVVVWRNSLLRALAIVATTALSNATSAQLPAEKQTPPSAVQELSASFRAAVKRVQPSVVFIETHSGPRKLAEWSKHESPAADNDPIRGPGIESHDRLRDVLHDASGTGIIFDARGYVLTCYHVVDGADAVFVRLADGRLLESVKVLADPLTDIAVVQIADAGKLTAATLADSGELQVGDWVVSIGNPYSLGLSVSAGIVSGTNRRSPLAPRTPLIQTDAASNPGNSGGALINLNGQVVGISQGGYGATEGFQGIGFAVPINVARRIARQLIDHGRVRRAALGCDTEKLSGEVAKYLGIVDGSGLVVTGVKPKTPAAEADIRIGDVITHFDGTQVHDNIEFLELMERAVPGRDIDFGVYRGRQPIEIVARPGELPERDQSHRMAKPEADDQPSGYRDVQLGVTVDQMSSELADKLGYSEPVEGIVVVQVQSKNPAATAGICAGMVVSRIDNEEVRSLEDYQRIMRKQILSRGILMLVEMPHRKHFLVVRQ